MSPYTTPLWAVQDTALPSFCRVLILSVSSASSTLSCIRSALWAFHHGSRPFSRSVTWTFFALADLGLSASHNSCAYAPRAQGKPFGVHRFRKAAFQSNSALQSLVPTMQPVQKTVEVPILQFVDRIVCVVVPLQRPTFLGVMLFPQVQYINQVGVNPVEMRRPTTVLWYGLGGLSCLLPARGSGYDKICLTVVYRKRWYFSPRGKIAWSRTFPSVPARTGECLFSQGFQ